MYEIGVGYLTRSGPAWQGPLLDPPTPNLDALAKNLHAASGMKQSVRQFPGKNI
jgi:hypothetical protein